jgi:hypothetical protein
MTYNLCKKLIEAGRFNVAEMLNKLDVFLLNGRISDEQYNELVALMGGGDK